MPSPCCDAPMGDCSGRAYQRKGWATWLCRHHWHTLGLVLAWAASPENEGDPLNPDTVRTLLDDYQDAYDPMRSGNGYGAGGLTLMPHAAYCTIQRSASPRCTCHLRRFVELDRLMDSMRHDRAHPLIEIADERVSVRALHWHVHQRYRRAEWTHKTVRYVAGNPVGVVQQPANPASKVYPLAAHQKVVVVDPGNWEVELTKMRRKHSRNPVDLRVRVVTWHPDVRLPLVDAGVAWIARGWTLEQVPEMIAA